MKAVIFLVAVIIATFLLPGWLKLASLVSMSILLSKKVQLLLASYTPEVLGGTKGDSLGWMTLFGVKICPAGTINGKGVPLKVEKEMRVPLGFYRSHPFLPTRQFYVEYYGILEGRPWEWVRFPPRY